MFSHMWTVYGNYIRFQMLSLNYEKRLCVCTCLSVLPSVRKEHLGSNLKDFHEIWLLNIFRKSVEIFEVY
jgi:hypothetical protein